MLVVHRAERSDVLVAALAQQLREVAGDPFVPELVAVPSKGVERWLAQQLGHVLGAGPAGDDGVCANVRFPPSSRLLDEAAAAADPAYGEAVERWAPELSTWPLMEAIDSAGPGDPWYEVLSAHLAAGGADSGRRFGVASRLARLFDRYGRSRPELLTAWAAGGEGADPLPEDLAWQPALWRRLREAVGPSPAELLEQACAAVGPGPGFSVFGATRLSPARVRVLHALGRVREVRLWLHHPSPALWAQVAARAERPGPRRGRPAAARHPLLASTARDVRELQQLLAAEPHGDVHHEGPAAPPTVLGDLQEQLRHDRPPIRRVASDSSLQIHTAHGAARQVEVVREVVLGLLAADPTLEPRDVVVMCPDVETFAPLVAASFGMTEESGAHPAAALRVSLADRSLRQTNPLLRLLLQVLDLAGGRVTATGVLDLAAAPPVRRRFRFDDDDLERLRDWTVGAGARWGLDQEHRAPYALGTVGQGTWRRAVDRLLLGATMEDSGGWLGDVVPVDDVDSGDIDLVGRFAEFVDRVDAAVRAVAARHTVAQWAEVLAGIVTGLGEGDAAWHAAQVHRELERIAAGAEGGESAVELGRADVVSLLGQRLAGRPTRSSFRTGTLTVCTLVPMRAVPHRVVVLLGMDDTAFPRRGAADGDDLLARDPRSGERDPRSEDRQLFLDAIGAATEHLVVVYTGHDPRTGAEVPPCVPVGELLDAVDATVEGGRAAVTTQHPLQPFDPRNFLAPRPFSFDPAGLAGARASRRERVPVPPLLSAPLPPPAVDPAVGDAVELDELVRFFEHPAKAFLRQRLNVATSFEADEPSDALPIDTAGLADWKIGERMLEGALAGRPVDEVQRLELLRGELPPGELGRATLVTVGRRVSSLLIASRAERELAVGPQVDVAVDVGGGRTLTGTVGGVRGQTLLTVTFSSLRAKQKLGAWIRHLAVVASRGEPDWSTVVVGRDRDGAARCVFAGVAPAEARRQLTRLVAVRAEGLLAPLPLFLQSSLRYAQTRRSGPENAVAAAARDWETGRFGAERDDPEHLLVFGPGSRLADLAADPAGGIAQLEGETTRFGALARLVWDPLLAAERAS